MVAAEILIAFVEAPRYREAGDDSSKKVFRFVGAHHRRTDAIEIFFARLLVKILQSPLPVFPVPDIVVAGCLILSEQRRNHLLPGLRPDPAETERQDEFPVTGGKIDLGCESYVSIFRALIFPLHLEVLREVLPTVRHSRESDGAFCHW